jgi:hypothetical protein
MSDQNAKPRLFDFPESLRARYANLDSDISVDGLTEKEREFLKAQIAEAKQRKKALAKDK